MKSKIYITAFCLIVMAIAIVVIYYTRESVRLGIDSKNWPITKGEITRASTVSNNFGGDGGGVSSSIFLEYGYIVSGSTFIANRVSFGKSSDNEWNFGSQLKKGMAVSVYYNPLKPSESVLLTGCDWVVALPVMVSSIFFILSCCFLGGIWCHFKYFDVTKDLSRTGFIQGKKL